MASNIDPTQPTQVTATTASVRLNFTYAKSEIESLQILAATKADKVTTINGYPLSANIALVKADVGLANVDNTSDVNKPVSTAQAAADLAATNAAKAYADSIILGLWNDRGSFNASVNTFPTTGGSGAAGAIQKGDIWTVSVVATSGPLLGIAVGSTVRALINAPAQTSTNWDILNVGIGYVAENSVNKDATGGYVGLTGFSINFKNAANTFTSYFANTNTASRTYTFPDYAATIATIAGVETLTNKTFTAPALGTPLSGVLTNCTGTAAGLTAGTVTTNANLTGDITSVGNATTLTNAPVIAKVLTGFVSGAGVVAATDTILQAFQKVDGNVATKVGQTAAIGSIITPAGTTAQRDGTPVTGYLRYNSTTGTIEYFGGTVWESLVDGPLMNAGTLPASFTTLNTTGTATSPAMAQLATVPSATGVAYGILARGTLSLSVNGDNGQALASNGGVVASGTATGLIFSVANFDGATWTKTGTGTIATAYGVYVTAPTIGTTNYAGYFSGNVVVTGTTNVSSLTVTNGYHATVTTEVISATYSQVLTDDYIPVNFAGTVTLTLLNPATYPGRYITIRTYQAQLVNSATANISLNGAVSSAILVATAGKWVELKSDGTNWEVVTNN